MILLAEDNTINQKLFRKLLNKAGCRVILASNGKQAVEKFIPGKFDLVMMDVQMPIMDGFEATELIRKTEKGNARTPVIAVTAHAMTGDREKCMAAGMNDYISKPVRKSRIIEILEKYIPPDDGSD
jgi:CheY-like chemotaxis protein